MSVQFSSSFVFLFQFVILVFQDIQDDDQCKCYAVVEVLRILPELIDIVSVKDICCRKNISTN